MTSSIPETMTAIAITEPGGPEVLVATDLPVPTPGEREILVHVEAAGVNRPDVLQRKGHYPPPPGASGDPGPRDCRLGGDGRTGGHALPPGDWICALVPGGGYAEYCVVHEDNALPVPEGLSAVEAAGIPETFFTVWTNVFERGGSRPGGVPVPWRLVGDRHDRDPARAGIRRARVRDRRLRREMPGVRGARRRSWRSTTETRISSNLLKHATNARAPTSSSTWLAAAIFARNIAAAAPDGASCRYRLLEGPKAEVDLRRSCISG